MAAVARQPQSSTGDRTLALRSRPGPPPSSASRAPTVISQGSRRHRSGTSHHGRSSSLSNNEYPEFQHSGDLEIVLDSGGQRKRFLLHRLILSQCSGFFEASTSEEWSKPSGYATTPNDLSSGLPALTMGEAPGSTLSGDSLSDTGSHAATRALSTHPGAHGAIRWRYELDWTDCREGETPMLVQRAAPSSSSSLFGGSSQPQPSRRSGLLKGMINPSVLHIASTQQSNHQQSDNTISDYDNLFRIFYNYVPNLSSTNIATAYLQSKSLLALADMYDALSVVGPRVDHHLLMFRAELWRQVQKYPLSYLKLSFAARSKVIFAEALIHVVGQWPQGANHVRAQMPPQVLDCIEDKVDEMDEMKRRAEVRLLKLSVSSNRQPRASPETNYLDWAAVSLFRHWFIESTLGGPEPPPSAQQGGTGANLAAPGQTVQVQRSGAVSSAGPTSGGTAGAIRAYRLIAAGGPAYLGHSECKRFLKTAPGDLHYTRETVRRFEAKVDEIKSLAREVVQPLMQSYLEGDSPHSGTAAPVSRELNYLTCTKVEDRDFPWED